ncbi:MAG: AmmeMemoRadiSam system radical SAM enzyme [Candidatus Omnitrophica bacterium]|nr:AmmeMemoRadiSam system radical SAM enzyme [Candidatus Omnitrophota bacterium]MDD5592186.1 AmmeMemoRadiSam system radical SAM enzyme [Candidatus Omnitrophota bacterium]
MREALLYEKLDGKIVRCYLCSHGCRIADKKFGLCGVRENRGGILYTYAYGKVIANHVDPIEKKPLYHFLPGSKSFSIATIGCNFRCEFCQNWKISQSTFREGGNLGAEEFPPQEIVKAAIENKCRSISYTYTEPTIFFEYALETAKLAKEAGLYNNFITNGYMSAECLEMIRPYLDAANVDLKFFKDSSYRKVCAASLAPVLDSIVLMHKLGIWLEITTLIVPQENDSEEELSGIAGFIAGIDKNIPWHVSRFHPDYKLTHRHPTPEATLEKAQAIGRKAGLKFIYAGNVYGWGNDTHCPNCKELIIKRETFSVLEYNIRQGKCVYCNTVIPGLFD